MLNQISEQQASKVVAINENFEAVFPAALFGINRSLSVGLLFAWYGGILMVNGAGSVIADGTIALTGSTTNYIERTHAGVVSKNTTGFTAGKIPLYVLVTTSTGISTVTDYRSAGSGFGALGMFGARGISCENNSGTPNTQYDLDADEIVLRDSSGATVLRLAPGAALTNNVSTAGPAAGGRDQSGAFSSSSWVHFYWIWNGTTLSTISSTVAPPTGPTLPTGYTHWAYATSIWFNGSSQLAKTYTRGSTVYYQNRADNILVNGGSATSETSINLANSIPPNAMSVIADATLAITGSTAGTVDTVDIRVATGVNYVRLGCATSTQVSSDNARSDVFFTAPNVGQNLYYIITKNTTGGTTLLTFIVEGYTVPNGG